MSAVADRVQEVLRPVVADAGYDLETVDVQPAGRRRLLRVVVDGDSGIDLDAIAALTRTLSSALDEAEAMGDQPYVLEVTSPGVDRPLTQPRHWRRARGHLVEVTLADGVVLAGRVQTADEEAAVLEVDGEPRRLAYATVRRASVQVEFNRPRPAGADPDGGA